MYTAPSTPSSPSSPVDGGYTRIHPANKLGLRLEGDETFQAADEAGPSSAPQHAHPRTPTSPTTSFGRTRPLVIP